MNQYPSIAESSIAEEDIPHKLKLLVALFYCYWNHAAVHGDGTNNHQARQHHLFQYSLLSMTSSSLRSNLKSSVPACGYGHPNPISGYLLLIILIDITTNQDEYSFFERKEGIQIINPNPIDGKWNS